MYESKSMRQVKDDLWKYHKKGFYICITTNGAIRKDGACVMGAGIARQAKQRYPDLPFLLGKRISKYGNKVFVFKKLKLITFPVKHHWIEKADLALIRLSTFQLLQAADQFDLDRIYLPRPGCKNGGRKWSEVKPLLKMLDNRFVICDLAR